MLSNDIPRLMEALPRALDTGTTQLAAAVQDRCAPRQHPHKCAWNMVCNPPPRPPRAWADSRGPLHFDDVRGVGAGVGATAGVLKGAGNGADDDDANPWGDADDAGGDGWALAEYVPRYKAQFDATQRGGVVSGAGAKPLLTATGLPTAKLRKIWELADVDKVERPLSLPPPTCPLPLYTPTQVSAFHPSRTVPWT